jgi:hypothetical protein
VKILNSQASPASSSSIPAAWTVPKNFQDFLSHQIFEHMHKALNVEKN